MPAQNQSNTGSAQGSIPLLRHLAPNFSLAVLSAFFINHPSGGITYLDVVDSTGATAINYGLSGVPETFSLNRQGVIVSKVTGELTEQTLQSNLQALLRST